MQLPNVLPCVADEGEDAAPAAGTEQPTASAAASEQPSSPLPTSGAGGTPKHSMLTQLEEGQIGKILRYRSGRVKLQLGDTHFDLDLGLDSGFLQVSRRSICLTFPDLKFVNLCIAGGHVHQQQSGAKEWQHD